MCNAMITLVILVFITFTTGAQEKPSDNSIVTQQDCTFPCWYGLVPGQTTLETARATLPIVPFFFLSKVPLSENLSPVDLQYHVTWGTGQSGGGLSFKDNILRSIIIYPNVPLTLRDIVTRYGNPDAWTAYQGNGGQIVLSVFNISLYYLTYGLIVDIRLYEGVGLTNYVIQPDAEAIRFILVPASSSIPEMLMDQWGESLNVATEEANNNFQYTWPGLFAKITLPSEYVFRNLPNVVTIIPPGAATLTAIPSVTLTPTYTPSHTPTASNTPTETSTDPPTTTVTPTATDTPTSVPPVVTSSNLQGWTLETNGTAPTYSFATAPAHAGKICYNRTQIRVSGVAYDLPEPPDAAYTLRG